MAEEKIIFNKEQDVFQKTTNEDLANGALELQIQLWENDQAVKQQEITALQFRIDKFRSLIQERTDYIVSITPPEPAPPDVVPGP